VLFASSTAALALGVLFVIKYYRDCREEAVAGQCQGRMAQIALALRNYHHDFGCLPPAYVTGRDGKPMHSWRVLLLPYMERTEFYRQYDFSQPWNSPHNAALAQAHPRLAEDFHCPADVKGAPEWTSYVAIVGPETLWPGSRPPSHQQLVAGSTKILLVEMAQTGIHWMEPRDLAYDDAIRGLVDSSPHRGRLHIFLATGEHATLEECGVTFPGREQSLISEWARSCSPFATGQQGDKKGQNYSSPNEGKDVPASTRDPESSSDPF